MRSADNDTATATAPLPLPPFVPLSVRCPGAVTSAFQRRWRRLFSCPPDLRVLMLGLDAAGKTTVWYRLKMDEAVATSPIGFGVETVQYKHFNFSVWDVGGEMDEDKQREGTAAN